MSHVFVSYSRRDRVLVLSLLYGLRQRGIPFWIDQDNISGGTYWDNAIENAIHDASCMLIVISPSAVESENVKDEYGKALELQKPIIPILIQDVDKLPMRFSRLQYIDFLTNYNQAIDRLLYQLESYLQPDTTQHNPDQLEGTGTSVNGEETQDAPPTKIYFPGDREKSMHRKPPHLMITLEDGGSVIQRTWVMQTQSIMLGRTWENDLVFHNGHISSRHARIYWQDGVYWIMDMGSRNGTFVNDEPLNGKPRTLTDNDQIRLASVCQIEFQISSRTDKTLPMRP